MIRNGRKMAQGSPPAPNRQSSMGAPARASVSYVDNAPIPGPPLTPGGSIGRPQPLRRPNQGERGDNSGNEDYGDGPNTQLDNPEAQEVMRREVYGEHIFCFAIFEVLEVLER